jgi:hypothetical protein
MALLLRIKLEFERIFQTRDAADIDNIESDDKATTVHIGVSTEMSVYRLSE